MSDLFDALVALAYLALAAIVFHRAMPAARPTGTLRTLRFWNLAVAIGLFGLAKLIGAGWLNDAGHLFLIVYVIQRMTTIVRHRPERWGRAA